MHTVGNDLWQIKRFDQQISLLLTAAAMCSSSHCCMWWEENTHKSITEARVFSHCRVERKGIKVITLPKLRVSDTVSDIFNPQEESVALTVTKSLWSDTNVGHKTLWRRL